MGHPPARRGFARNSGSPYFTRPKSAISRRGFAGKQELRELLRQFVLYMRVLCRVDRDDAYWFTHAGSPEHTR